MLILPAWSFAVRICGHVICDLLLECPPHPFSLPDHISCFTQGNGFPGPSSVPCIRDAHPCKDTVLLQLPTHSLRLHLSPLVGCDLAAVCSPWSSLHTCLDHPPPGFPMPPLPRMQTSLPPHPADSSLGCLLSCCHPSWCPMPPAVKPAVWEGPRCRLNDVS